MPAEESEPCCKNCGKVGGDCEELEARRQELQNINDGLRIKTREYMKEARKLSWERHRNRRESKKLRMTILRRHRDLLKSKVEDAE